MARAIGAAESRAYNYVIVVGALALIAVYVPLHAILRSGRARATYRAAAMAAAAAGSAAAFVGAGLGGTLWQTVPTGVFLAFLGILVALRVLGGWRGVRRGVRGCGAGRVGAVCLEDGFWKGDVGREEWEKTAAAAGLGRGLLLLGGEADRDAVAVGLLRRRLWRVGGDSGDAREGPASVAVADSHEPVGVVILGLVAHASRWLPPLLTVLAGDRRRRRAAATVHHVAMVLWLAGMLAGAVAKTGWWPASFAAKPGTIRGSESLRTGGIWIQSLLLLIAVFTLPYTRGAVRLGARKGPRLGVAGLQAGASVTIGAAMLAFAREPDVDGNNVAYCIALAASATAAATWSLLAVWAYGVSVERLLRDRDDGGEEGEEGEASLRLRAYLAALVTRPRYGHVGKMPAARWGDVGHDGRAGLEVQLEMTTSGDGMGKEDCAAGEAVAELDEDAAQEWAMLEGRMRRKTLGI